jgi:hypothetical protein
LFADSAIVIRGRGEMVVALMVMEIGKYRYFYESLTFSAWLFRITIWLSDNLVGVTKAMGGRTDEELAAEGVEEVFWLGSVDDGV